MATICLRRGVDLSNVNVYLDSSKTPLSLITTETFWLGGKHLRIKGNSFYYDKKKKCSTFYFPIRACKIHNISKHACTHTHTKKHNKIIGDGHILSVYLLLVYPLTEMLSCGKEVKEKEEKERKTRELINSAFVFMTAKDGIKSPVRSVVPRSLLQHQSSRKSSGVSCNVEIIFCH